MCIEWKDVLFNISIVMVNSERKVKCHSIYFMKFIIYIVFRLIFFASKYLLQKGKNSSISIIFSFQSKLFTTICVLFLIICLVESHQRPSENQSVLLHRHKRSKELIDKFKKVRSSIVFGYEKNCIFF